MADEFDYGSFDWGGMPSYSSPEPTFAGRLDFGSAANSYNPYNIPSQSSLDAGYNASDPASAYWQPEYNPASSINPYSLPSGGGVYSVGQGDWSGIYAPAQPSTPTSYASASQYDTMRGATPAYTTNYGVGGYSGESLFGGGSAPAQYNPSNWQPPKSSSSYSQPSYQRIALGQPERTLYDRYSQLLRNPEGMSQDPAYQFLFNQGSQALNRSLASKGLMQSGKSLTDNTQFGQGLAFDYMTKMLPQYQAGAREELARFMGPAGLLPGYANTNNQTSNMEGQNRASEALMPYYQRMLEQSMGGGGSVQPGGGASFGGVSGSYNPTSYSPRLEQAWGQQPQRQPETFDINDPDLVWQN